MLLKSNFNARENSFLIMQKGAILSNNFIPNVRMHASLGGNKSFQGQSDFSSNQLVCKLEYFP